MFFNFLIRSEISKADRKIAVQANVCLDFFLKILLKVLIVGVTNNLLFNTLENIAVKDKEYLSYYKK